MGFVLEELSDDDRRRRGFAPTMDEVDVRRGMSFVDVWAYDKDLDAILIGIRKGVTDVWLLELHWEHFVIGITARVRRELCKNPDMSNTHSVDMYFEVKELVIPVALQDMVEEIKHLTAEGLRAYVAGSPKHNGIAYVRFPSDMTTRFSALIKSRARLSDFESMH